MGIFHPYHGENKLLLDAIW